MWGATSNLPIKFLGTTESKIEIKNENENFKKRISWLKITMTPVILSYFYTSGYVMDHFNWFENYDMTQIMSVYTGIPTALFLQVVTILFAKQTVGFKGLLISMKENKIEVVSSQHFSKKSIYGLSNSSCDQLFLESKIN